jgi:hypothetical protein
MKYVLLNWLSTWKTFNFFQMNSEMNKVEQFRQSLFSSSVH